VFTAMPAKTAGILIVLAVGQALAQEDAPPGLLRGEFVSWSGTPRGGDFTFRSTTHQLYSCSYDQKTYIERWNQRITFAGADKGDRLELISDHRLGSVACYARMVQILDVPPAHAVAGVRPRLRSPSPIAALAPRGNMTVAGVVLRVFPELLVLKLRSGEHAFVCLRSDTQYLAQGQPSAAGSLRANTLVFVRAARNLDGEVEAYQVIWGEILQSDQ
jgi:hypothetical protein